MKRLLALLLALALFLPVLAFGESDIDLEEELVEDVDLDDGDDEFGSAEIKEEDLLSEDLRKEMAASLESADYTPKELDIDSLYINENLPTDKVINILLLTVFVSSQSLANSAQPFSRAQFSQACSSLRANPFPRADSRT